MVNDFLIISFTGKNDLIALRVNKKFFIKKLQATNIRNNNLLVNKIFDFVNEKKAIINETFSIIVNLGPGSFTGLRISLSVAKGMKIAKGAQLYGYKDTSLSDFNLENINILIKKNLLEKNLIKPVYSS